MHNIIPRLSETPGRLRTPAPGLGQHTRSVLESIGFGADRLAALAAAGVIPQLKDGEA
jgi:formyl-CoA transferase